MKAIKMKDIQNKTQADLMKMVAEKREALRMFRFGGAGAKTKDVKQGRVLRKDIARMLTVINTQKNSESVAK